MNHEKVLSWLIKDMTNIGEIEAEDLISEVKEATGEDITDLMYTKEAIEASLAEFFTENEIIQIKLMILNEANNSLTSLIDELRGHEHCSSYVDPVNDRRHLISADDLSNMLNKYDPRETQK